MQPSGSRLHDGKGLRTTVGATNIHFPPTASGLEDSWLSGSRHQKKPCISMGRRVVVLREDAAA